MGRKNSRRNNLEKVAKVDAASQTASVEKTNLTLDVEVYVMESK